MMAAVVVVVVMVAVVGMFGRGGPADGVLQ